MNVTAMKKTVSNEDLLKAMQSLSGGMHALTLDMREVKEHITLLKTDVREVKDDVQTLKVDVQTLKVDVQELKNDVQVLRTDVRTLKIDVEELKTDVQTLKDEVAVLKVDVQALKADVQTLKVDVDVLKIDVQTLQTDMRAVKITIGELQTDVHDLKRDVADNAENLRAVMHMASEGFDRLDFRLEALETNIEDTTGEMIALRREVKELKQSSYRQELHMDAHGEVVKSVYTEYIKLQASVTTIIERLAVPLSNTQPSTII